MKIRLKFRPSIKMICFLGMVWTGIGIGLSIPCHGFANDSGDMTIFFTGNLQERIKVHPRCGLGMLGGLLRRATMVEQLRQKSQPLLVLDAGGMFHGFNSDSKKRADFTFTAMNQMEYDVINIGDSEFIFGAEYLASIASHAKFAMVSANLLYRGQKPLWLKTYVIREINGMRIGITGVASPQILKQAQFEESWHLEALPPDTVMDKLIPEIREQADMVILLSQLGLHATVDLVQQIQGIDLAICSRQSKEEAGTDEKKYLQLGVVQADFYGADPGLIRIKRNSDGKFIADNLTYYLLNDQYRRHNYLSHVYSDMFSGQKEARARQFQQMQGQLQQGLRLSPEEFLNQLNQDPIKQGDES